MRIYIRGKGVWSREREPRGVGAGRAGCSGEPEEDRKSCPNARFITRNQAAMNSDEITYVIQAAAAPSTYPPYRRVSPERARESTSSGAGEPLLRPDAATGRNFGAILFFFFYSSPFDDLCTADARYARITAAFPERVLYFSVLLWRSRISPGESWL